MSESRSPPEGLTFYPEKPMSEKHVPGVKKHRSELARYTRQGRAHLVQERWGQISSPPRRPERGEIRGLITDSFPGPQGAFHISALPSRHADDMRSLLLAVGLNERKTKLKTESHLKTTRAKHFLRRKRILALSCEAQLWPRLLHGALP